LKDLKTKLTILVERFAQAWSACMLAMVQGDVTVLTFNHAIVASKTGLLTGLAMVVASLYKDGNKWLGIYLTGLFTMIADFFVHAEHFPLEAVVTGLGAMALATIYDKGKEIYASKKRQ